MTFRYSLLAPSVKIYGKLIQINFENIRHRSTEICFFGHQDFSDDIVPVVFMDK